MKSEISYEEKMQGNYNYYVKKSTYNLFKRPFDIFLSLILLIVFFPFFGVLSAIIFLCDFHNPFYVQKRVGRTGKQFNLYKFRTMKYDADDLEKHFTTEQIDVFRKEYKIDNDPRITKIGIFMRKFSIDEFPQVINVIIGNMSLIGPRPITFKELENFGDDKYDLLSVRPGITGLWQVSGRNSLTYESGTRQKTELEYVKKYGIGIDLKIFFKTFREIFVGGGT